MVRGIEQLYQDTADAASRILEKRLPGDYAQAWIRVEMPGEINHVACFYSPAVEPEKICPMASNAGLVDIYLIFDKISSQLEKSGDKVSAISLLINSSGEYFFELGTGSQLQSHDRAGTLLESAVQDNSVIETVHFSPDTISA